MSRTTASKIDIGAILAPRDWRRVALAIGAWVVLTALPAALQGAAAIPIANLDRSTRVDFVTEILPILRNNCLACHNQTRSKAELVLENPQTILKGSENGPVIVPGHSESSLLLKVASHQAKPAMPPRDNPVAAVDLTPRELGLIQLWIDQGAGGEGQRSAPIAWQPLPEKYRPVYAIAISSDGQIVAVNRASQVFIYHLPSARLLTCLADPALAEAQVAVAHRLAHRDSVRALAFSPDGDHLASGGYREVKLWRRNRSARTFEVPPLSMAITAGCLSSDGNWMAVGEGTGRISLRALSGTAAAKTICGGPAAVRCLSFSPAGDRLLAISEDHGVRVWDVRDGSLLAERRPDVTVTASAWLDSGQQIVLATAGGFIQVWPLLSKAKDPPVTRFESDGAELWSLQPVAARPAELLSGDMSGAIGHWDLESGELISERIHGAPVVAIATSNDGTRWAAAGSDNTVSLWAANTGGELARLQGDRYAYERLAASARALRFATNELSYCQGAFETAEKDRKAQLDRVRKATDALSTAEKPIAEKRKKLDETAKASAAAQKVVTAIAAELATARQTFEGIQAGAQKAREALTASLQALGAAPMDHAGTNGADPSASRAQAQAAAERAASQLFDQAQAAGQAKLTFERVVAEKSGSQKEAETKLAAAKKQEQEADADLKKALQNQSNADNELTLSITAAQRAAERATEAQNAIPLAQAAAKRLEADLEEARRSSVQAEKPVQALSFSPDNLLLATAGDDRMVHTWNARTGEAIETLRQHETAVTALAFRSSHELVSLSADGAAIGWELNPEWTLEAVFGTGDADSPFSDTINALAFSPDGQTLAVGSGEPSRSGQIQLWNVAQHRLVQEFKDVHSDAVFGLAFSRDGQWLASSAADRFMRVIDLRTGKVARSFEGHTHHVLGVAWKQDGRTLATAGADNVAKLWDFRSGERRKNIDGFEKEVTSVSCFAGDQFLITSGDHQVRIINEKGETVRAFTSSSKEFLYAAAATLDGTWVVAGGQGGSVWVWNGRTGDLLGPLPVGNP